MTDSEQVPWGKGEKNPGEGSEIDLKPYAYKESERCCTKFVNFVFVSFVQHRHGVPIEEWANELMCSACLNAFKAWRLRETECE